MRLLVDTHAFLWQILADPRSSATAVNILADEENELVFSFASLWEVAINMQLGRLKSVGSSVATVHDTALEFGMELLPIRYEHILALESLPMHHRDPFDRLLIAQAIAESIPILTHDSKFQQYDVKTIW